MAGLRRCFLLVTAVLFAAAAPLAAQKQGRDIKDRIGLFLEAGFTYTYDYASAPTGGGFLLGGRFFDTAELAVGVNTEAHFYLEARLAPRLGFYLPYIGLGYAYRPFRLDFLVFGQKEAVFEGSLHILDMIIAPARFSIKNWGNKQLWTHPFDLLVSAGAIKFGTLWPLTRKTGNTIAGDARFQAEIIGLSFIYFF